MGCGVQSKTKTKLIHIHQPSPIEARDEGLNGRAPVKVCSGLTSTVYVLCVCVRDRTQVQISLRVTWLKILPSFRVVRSALIKKKTCWCKYHGRAYWFKVNKTVLLSEKLLTAKLTEALCRMASCRCNVCRKNISSLMAWKLKREIVNVAELVESNITKNWVTKLYGVPLS